MNKLKIILVFLFAFGLMSFAVSDLQKKLVRQNGYNIECFTSTKQKKADHSKMYYWFKAGKVHNSESSIGGLLLHNAYSKYYRSNQLAEKGAFNYGLKNDLWTSWFENGLVNEQYNWKNGHKQGDYILNDEDGILVTKGYYKNNLKHGVWINYKTKDTVSYKLGNIKPKSKKKKETKKGIKKINKKTPFFKRIFKKKNNTKKVVKKEKK